MAKIILESSGKEVEIKDGSEIQKVCEDELSIPFSCKDGSCGTCLIGISGGMENLSEVTEKEKDIGISGDYRLACQCKINKGNVKIKN